MSKRLGDYESYGENPFVMDRDSVHFRRILVKRGDTINEATGEVVDKGEYVTVDNKPFIKVYKEALPLFQELSNRGSRVLFRVMEELGNLEDEVYIHAPSYAKAFGVKNVRDINFGIKELLDRDILCKKAESCMYFVNVRLLFNGNRVRYKMRRER